MEEFDTTSRFSFIRSIIKHPDTVTSDIIDDRIWFGNNHLLGSDKTVLCFHIETAASGFYTSMKIDLILNKNNFSHLITNGEIGRDDGDLGELIDDIIIMCEMK